VIFKLIDWYLRKHEQRRAGRDEPLVVTRIKEVIHEIPVEVIREIPVEVIREVCKHPVDAELVESASLLCAALEHTTHGGEWKRHQVYAHLIKHYPNAKRRDIALAIEYALRESNGSSL